MKFLVLALLVAFACASEIEKREAEPSYRGYGHVSYHHRPSYGYGYSNHYHKRSADPEPEADHSYGSSYGYRPRSADPEQKLIIPMALLMGIAHSPMATLTLYKEVGLGPLILSQEADPSYGLFLWGIAHRLWLLSPAITRVADLSQKWSFLWLFLWVSPSRLWYYPHRYHKRSADPAARSLIIPMVLRYGYRPQSPMATLTAYHKRQSADPEPEYPMALLSPLFTRDLLILRPEDCIISYGSSMDLRDHHPDAYGYSHRYHKRSADSEPEADHSYGSSYGYRPVAYGYSHRYHKRSADPEPEADHSYGSTYGYRPVAYGYPHYYHKRSADPEPEADHSYGSSYGYRPVTYGYSHRYHKRSADPEPEAEPSHRYGHSYGYPSYRPVIYG
ncbi:uncharacterized protein LOC135218119 [Macrobrachium nipponense]|uniref:uncharacterized protein LOC135218119 n=1 Tax=Macrobrachium nipponense TaxID=159736 RepID=UPI0030C8A9EB